MHTHINSIEVGLEDKDLLPWPVFGGSPLMVYRRPHPKSECAVLGTKGEHSATGKKVLDQEDQHVEPSSVIFMNSVSLGGSPPLPKPQCPLP